MTSSRLPGKVLMPAGGKPLLQILIERLRRSREITEIIVATTTNDTDLPIVELCEDLKIRVFRGSELNVLERVCGAARFGEADIIAEVTADCPLIDVSLVDGAIHLFHSNYPTCKYVTNARGIVSMPWGFDIQVYAASDLYAINAGNPDDDDREHVSCQFYAEGNRDRYNPIFIEYEGELNRPELRVTLDYPEDYQLMKAVHEDLVGSNPEYSSIDIIRWLDAHPEIRDAAIKCRE